MTGTFKGINRKFMSDLVAGMNEDVADFMDIPFDEFVELIRSDTIATSIKNITQSVNKHMNMVGPSGWFFEVVYRPGNMAHFTRTKKR